MMHARRALLYMPGDDRHKIEKATSLGVDSICMDMEDGVAANRKEEARETIREALSSLDFSRSEKLVRINPIGSGLEEMDILTVVPSHPDGVVIPKVESGDQIRWAGRKIAQIEREWGWTVGGIHLLVIVESARGIVNLKEIAGADPRLQGLIFGAEDFAGDVGLVRTPESWEVFYARSAVVTHAAAFDLQAIDQVYIDFRDVEGLRRDAEQGAMLGFAGKQVIHPLQVEPVQEAFSPSEAEIDYAKRIMEAFHQHQAAGRGAFAFEGKMIDAPIIKAAERVLAKAQATGKME